MVTVIRKLDWAVVWNSNAGQHEYARGIDIAFDASGLIHVGKDYSGPPDEGN